jgi:hypothetical protein
MFNNLKPLGTNPSNPFDFVATIKKEKKGITHHKGIQLSKGCNRD